MVGLQGKAVDNMLWSDKIGVWNGGALEVKSDRTEGLFFAAVHKKDTLYFAERRLAMDASPNFRDLGGLKTTDGRTVKWGKLFRCGDMGSLLDLNLHIIENENITNLFYFRNTTEIEKSPDKYPTGYTMNRIHANIGSKDGKSTGKFMQVLADPNVTVTDAENTFASFYPEIMLGAKDYQPMFDELLENSGEEGLLFHCSAEKDRTGIASALILSALNVPEETIVQEYYLSNRYTKNALTKGMVRSGLKPEIAEVLSRLTGANLPKQKIDGIEFVDLLKGDESKTPREEFLYYYRKNSLEAVRKQNWKLVFEHPGRTYEGSLPGKNGQPGPAPEDHQIPKALYDLARDPGERYNVLEQNAEIVSELENIAAAAREDLGDDLQKVECKNRRPIGKSEKK